MTDIWDEKPTQYRSGSLSYYNAVGMNAWLEKVDQLITILNDTIRIQTNNLSEMKMENQYLNGKAEKWDAQIAKSLTYAVMEQKLEAIKKVYQEYNSMNGHRLDATSSWTILGDFKKILGVEE